MRAIAVGVWRAARRRARRGRWGDGGWYALLTRIARIVHQLILLRVPSNKLDLAIPLIEHRHVYL